VTRERALADAAAIDARRAREEALPPLAGVPFAAKNLYDIAGVTTITGSKIHAQTSPAARDHAAGDTGSRDQDVQRGMHRDTTEVRDVPARFSSLARRPD
jgi:hypothetical protein